MVGLTRTYRLACFWQTFSGTFSVEVVVVDPHLGRSVGVPLCLHNLKVAVSTSKSYQNRSGVVNLERASKLRSGRARAGTGRSRDSPASLRFRRRAAIAEPAGRRRRWSAGAVFFFPDEFCSDC